MIYKRFGERIRELRYNEGLTLTQLAAKLEIDSANLSKIENGKRGFDERKLQALCKVFNLDFDKELKELISDRFAFKVFSESIDSSIFPLAEKKLKHLIDLHQTQTEIKFQDE